MNCPAIRYFCNSPSNLKAIAAFESWSTMTREQRRMSANMSFVWRELWLHLQEVLQPESSADLRSAIEVQDIWELEYFLIRAATTKVVAGAKDDTYKVWYGFAFQNIETQLGPRSCLVASLYNLALRAAVRDQLIQDLSSHVGFGEWDSSGKPFVPPKEIALRWKKSATLVITASDLTNIAVDDLDEFLLLAVATYKAGLSRAIQIDPALGRFVE